MSITRRATLTGALWGCVTIGAQGCAITSEGLAPQEPVKPARRIMRTVRIMPVQGGRASTFGREAYITNEQYHEALSRTLAEAHIFAGIKPDGGADLELHSEIITITTEGGLSPAYAIVVQYWLVDPSTGKEVWRKGINARHQVQWNEAFAGGTRIIMAVNGATQKNLTRLVEALAASDLR
jgi:hypothetical protein